MTLCSLLLRCGGVQIGVVGSAAVRAARLAKRETYRLQRRAEEAEARCEEMQGRLVELEQEVGELASANAPADGVRCPSCSAYLLLGALGSRAV